MSNSASKLKTVILTIRWIARIGSIASIGLILLFIIGEGFENLPHMWQQWIGFLFFPVGIVVGMIIGWQREGVGGTITVGSLLVFYGVYFLLDGLILRGWAWIVFTSPGILFLASWLLSRSMHEVAT